MGQKRKPKQLTVAQEKFCLMVLDPTDKRTVGAKAAECGFNATYGYQLLRVPAVAAFIEREARLLAHSWHSRTTAIMEKIAEMAEAGDLKAADLYLEACGVTGKGSNISVTTQVTNTNDEPLVDRLRALRSRN